MRGARENGCQCLRTPWQSHGVTCKAQGALSARAKSKPLIIPSRGDVVIRQAQWRDHLNESTIASPPTFAQVELVHCFCCESHRTSPHLRMNVECLHTCGTANYHPNWDTCLRTCGRTVAEKLDKYVWSSILLVALEVIAKPRFPWIVDMLIQQ